jgi:recombination protein RecT
MTTTISAELERQQQAQATVERYREKLYEILPSHLAGMEKTWMRVAFGAIRKNPKLIDACVEDPDAMINALFEAGRLGLEPGTDEYYLTPRRRKLSNGRYVASVLGIIGYQGEVELIYRAGAVSSVICDLKYQRDIFVWRPGARDREYPPRWDGPQRQPYHEADWFGDRGGDGPPHHGVEGAYAYCIMLDGSISKVVIVDQRRISRAMAASKDSDNDNSPWQTDYPAMVLKTAAHDIAKWVPTSAEYRQRPTVASERVSGGSTAMLTRAHTAGLDKSEARALEPSNPTPPTEAEVTTAEFVEQDSAGPSSSVPMEHPPQSEPTAEPDPDTSFDWTAAIAEAVANGNLAALTDLWESAKHSEPGNIALAEQIRAAGKQVKDAHAEAVAYEPEKPRDTLRNQMFALLGEAGIRDTDPGGRERRLLICSRLLTIMPVIGSTKELSDIQLGQINAALIRHREEGTLESTLANWTVASQA